jgi:hypothetical protein
MSKQITFKTDDSMERILGLLENLDRIWDLQIMEIDLAAPPQPEKETK